MNTVTEPLDELCHLLPLDLIIMEDNRHQEWSIVKAYLCNLVIVAIDSLQRWSMTYYKLLQLVIMASHNLEFRIFSEKCYRGKLIVITQDFFYLYT